MLGVINSEVLGNIWSRLSDSLTDFPLELRWFDE
jgi:hypothetical protein